MRIYEELVRQKMLTSGEGPLPGDRLPDMSSRFLDFTKGSQSADNHSFGNAGGIAMTLKLFPEAPQSGEARAWIGRIWKHLADFGDWTEWNYFPYGPIFLHGMIDIAEAMGWIESEAELIHAVGKRVLGFIHGGGLRGGPNCGSTVFPDRAALYAIRGTLVTIGLRPRAVTAISVSPCSALSQSQLSLGGHAKCFRRGASRVACGPGIQGSMGKALLWFQERHNSRDPGGQSPYRPSQLPQK